MSGAGLSTQNRFTRFFAHYWGVLGLVIAWQLWVMLSGMTKIVLPSPVAVVADLALHLDAYWLNALTTLAVAVLGLVLGITLGTALAVASWSSRLLSGLLTPIGLIFTSVPVVAMIPIIARMLGYDVKTVIAVVTLICFFPAYVFVGAGLRALPPGTADLFAVLGAGRWQRFRRLVLPSAVPNAMIALRLTAPDAILAAMLAEFLMGTTGLGYMFRDAAAKFDTDRALGTSLVATVISVIVFALMLAAERRVNARWK